MDLLDFMFLTIPQTTIQQFAQLLRLYSKIIRFNEINKAISSHQMDNYTACM